MIWERRLALALGAFLLLAGLAILWIPGLDHQLLEWASVWKGRPPKVHWMGKLHREAWKLAGAGAAGLVLGGFVFPRWPGILSLTDRLAARKWLLLTVSWAILAGLWLPVIFIDHSQVYGGERYWTLGEDAMISMRYAKNLARGDGFVWNVGERVEGYSNFLWTLYMALIHGFQIPVSKTSLVILLTNLILAGVTIPPLLELIRRLGGGTFSILGVLTAYLLNRSILTWGTEGFEATLLTFLFILSLNRVLKESQEGEPKFLTYLLLGILSLVRADALVLSGSVFLAALALNENKKKTFCYGLVTLAFPLAHEIFRIWYYGDLLPNTAHLKVLGWEDRWKAGVEYVISFAKKYAAFLIATALGSFLVKERPYRVSIGVFTGTVVYLLYIGGDAFVNFRFFVPVLPLLFALGFRTIQSLNLRSNIRLTLALICLGSMPLVFPSDLAKAFLPQAAQENIGVGLFLKKNTAPEAKIAHGWAGTIPYFSERYAIDLLGKSDRYIARLAVVSKSRMPGHNKYDYDYSLGKLRPDYLVVDREWPIKLNRKWLRKLAADPWGFVGRIYYHPLFRKHCEDHVVLSGRRRTVFACDWPEGGQ